MFGMDLSDDSLFGTEGPKMFVNEIFMVYIQIISQELLLLKTNTSTEMLVEKNITVYSTCEHHLLPIVGNPWHIYQMEQ